jgi:ATP-dependent exoDNAse (exonuclease V) beta subunit
VWWDPAVLELGVRASIGLSQTRILEAGEDSQAGPALAAWRAWRETRERVREQGARPTRRVETATDWIDRHMVEGSREVEVIGERLLGERPSGPRFGTLVHAVLSVVPLGADRDPIAQHAAVQARLLGASDAERESAVQVVAAALREPIVQRAALAEREHRCRRETSLVLRLDDGTMVESVVDLAFQDVDGWTVVDFKTDAELGGRLEAYRRQVALYAQGIAQATGLPAKGVLLRV